MKKILALLVACVALLALPAFAASSDADKARAEIRSNSQKILNQLYKANPRTKQLIASSAGYATFANFGMKIFFAGGGTGSGMAVDNKTKKEVFMKMVEVQAGLGFGAKKFRLVFVFDNESALRNFVESGWEAGAQASAAATDGGGKGEAYQGAISVAPGVRLFQMTDQGIALEATVKGTKYYKNDDLN
jgi:lipid-binding SYLF domain-containing protein